MRSLLPLTITAFALIACGPKSTTMEDFQTRPLTLPGGQILRVETMSENIDLLRGLMYRKSLAPDRGMLLAYPKPGHYQMFMYKTLIPLDVIWMDGNRDIIDINYNLQPCPETTASKCQRYGGKQLEEFALEVPAGMAQKFGLQPGQRINW